MKIYVGPLGFFLLFVVMVISLFGIFITYSVCGRGMSWHWLITKIKPGMCQSRAKLMSSHKGTHVVVIMNNSQWEELVGLPLELQIALISGLVPCVTMH